MAVIDLRGSGAGELSGDFARLTQGLMHILLRDKIEQAGVRRQMLGTPEGRQQIASAGREFQQDIQTGEIPVDPRIGDATERDVDVPKLPGQAIGISPEMLVGLQRLYPTTFEEELDRELRSEGAPKIEAERQTAVARAALTEAEMNIETLGLLQNLGFGEARAKTEMSELISRGMRSDQIRTAVDETNAALEGMSKKDQMLYQMYISNQGFANLLADRERRAWQERMANAVKTDSPFESAVDMAEVRIMLNRERAKLINEIREAVDNRERDLLPGLAEQFRQLSDTQLYFFPHDVVMTAREVERIFGDEIKDIEFGTFDNDAFKVEQAARLIADPSNNITMETLMRTEDLDTNYLPMIQERVAQLQGLRETPSITDLARQAEQTFANVTTETLRALIEDLEVQKRELRDLAAAPGLYREAYERWLVAKRALAVREAEEAAGIERPAPNALDLITGGQ